MYKSVLTSIGESKIATAAHSGVKLDLAIIAVGDGNGEPVTPSIEMTALVREVARFGISDFSINYEEKTISVETIIPPETGGWTIRELGVFDTEGDLIAVANYPETEKPVSADGIVTDLALGMVFVVSAVTSVNIIINESTAMAGFVHPARAATTGNVTLTGLQVIDGINLAVGDRVLVKNQSSAAENGIYVVLEGQWTRALDYDGDDDILPGSLISVVEGTSNGGYVFQLNTPASIVVGTTGLSFNTFSKREHGHTQNDISGLPATLASLSEAISGKAPTSHSHTASDLPTASETGTGIVELATLAEALAGTDAVRVITPAVLAALKNIANGLAGLAADGKIPAAILPSYVDDVLEYANPSAFPAVGESGKIYTAIDSKKIYRWSGSVYAEISPSPGSTDEVSEGSINLYFTAARGLAAVADALASKAALLHYHAATDITSGTLPTTRGGTGKASYTSARYLRTTSTSVIGEYTPAQVLADIGAAASSHTHAKSQITDLDFSLYGAANGYQMLPSGLIIQWGTFATADTNTVTVYFPTAFPNACVSVVSSITTATRNSNGFVHFVENITNSKFEQYNRGMAAGTSKYIAIGW